MVISLHTLSSKRFRLAVSVALGWFCGWLGFLFGKSGAPAHGRVSFEGGNTYSASAQSDTPVTSSGFVPYANGTGTVSLKKQLCMKNPWVQSLALSDIEANEVRAEDWYSDLLPSTQNLLALAHEPEKPPTIGLDLGPYPSDLGGSLTAKRFDPMAVNAICGNLDTLSESLGAGGAGGNQKILCSLSTLKATDCVVFSIGSNNAWGFEIGVSAALPHCKIFTFDCFVEHTGVPTQIQKTTTFLPLCAGNTRHGNQFRDLEGVAKEVGVDHIDILKMDAEGAEWDLLPHFLTKQNHLLPFQFTFELHLCERNSLISRARGTVEVAFLANLLFNAGYRIIAIDEVSAKCREFTAVRVFC